MRPLLLCLPLFACGSVQPQPSSHAPAGLTSSAHVVPAAERAELEQLAARVDLLRVLRSDMVRAGHDLEAARATWSAHLEAVDERLAAFLAAHRDLHPRSRARLRARVTRPLEALRRTGDS